MLKNIIIHCNYYSFKLVTYNCIGYGRGNAGLRKQIELSDKDGPT